MDRSEQRILEQALRLSPGARAKLAAKLIESLDEADEDDVEAAWAVEILRRRKELESGAVKAVPRDEALKQILDDGEGP
jgi:putative addiction module component (TIGR02574 family)